MYRKYNEKGFTLIELLIVIVIIGILAGVVIAVLNPAQQQRKARESVLRSNTDKICLAMHSCAASRQYPETNCATMTDINVNDPSNSVNPPGVPTGAEYAIAAAGGVITVTGTDTAGCIFECTYNTATGQATQVSPQVPADCLID